MMGNKKMKLLLLPSFLFKNKEHVITKQPWQWPSCNSPRTLSFRVGQDICSEPMDDPPESWFTNSPESASSSGKSEDYFGGSSVEKIIRDVRSSERLFFEPGGGGDSSSILEKAKPGEEEEEDEEESLPFKESVVLAMESEDPYEDFKKSMEEMVLTHELKDWECLEQLLGWYLKMNGKINHEFIVGAFVDLLLGIASSSFSSSSDSTSFSSAASSFYSSSPISLSPRKKKTTWY